METNELATIGVGTGLWAVALVVLLVVGDRLGPDRQWWVWTCVTGLCLGVVGLGIVYHRARTMGGRAVRQTHDDG